MASHLTPLPKLSLLIFLLLVSGLKLTSCANITIINSCKETIWPGIAQNNNSNNGDGFTLKPGQTAVFTAPPEWSGRIWGRTGCQFDKTGNGTCQTGGCGTSIKCTGPGNPPASIAEFTLGETNFYDVSLVDGFNLPLIVRPINGKGNCSAAGCDSDLRENCPPELVFRPAGKPTVACRSACNVFDTDEYCCRGMYSNPVTCLPSNYSRAFKTACPLAYSYAYDDPTSILTCSATDYVVAFCGSRNQTQCTYHDNKLVCNGSNSLKGLHQIWAVILLALPMIMVNAWLIC